MRFRKNGCVLSVFFALISVLTASLILSIAESVRTQYTRAYLTVAADSAADSLCSQYHYALWDRYRLLGVEEYSVKEAEHEFYEFLRPYLSGVSVKNWYALSAEEEDIRLEDHGLLTDRNGEVFEKEVSDYMRYGIVADVMDLSEVKDAGKLFTEGRSAASVSEGYAHCSLNALDLEDSLKKIGKYCDDQKKEVERMKQALSSMSAAGAEVSAATLCDTLSEIPEAVTEYEAAAEELDRQVKAAQTDLEERYRNGDFSEETYRMLLEETAEYESYSAENGKIRSEIRELSEKVPENRRIAEETARLAREAEEYIENYTPSPVITGYLPPEKEGDPPIPVYEEDEPDTEAAWAPARACFSAYELPETSFQSGIADEEKKKALEEVADLLKGDLLKLVLPEGTVPDETEYPLAGCPSGKYPVPEGTCDEEKLTDRLYVAEYAASVLDSFCGENRGSGHLECEYVVYGRRNDRENLADMAAELVGIRTGLNLIHVLSDSEKRAEARALSLALTGLAAATPLSTVLCFLIMSTWAGAQAVLDVRDLLAGEKVPLCHDRESFYLSLSGLLSDFSHLLSENRTGGKGLGYRTWLKMILFLHIGSEAEYRILDMIQMNLRKEQEDFTFDRVYSSVVLSIRASSRHIFTFLVPGSRPYSFTVETAYSY